MQRQEPTATQRPDGAHRHRAGNTPTAEDLLAFFPPTTTAAQAREVTQEVVQAAENHRAALNLPMACGEDCIHPSHHHASTADLDMRDRNALERPFFVPGIPTAHDLARAISCRFWPLCQAIEEMDDREQIRPALDVLHSRIQTVYALLDEATVSQVG